MSGAKHTPGPLKLDGGRGKKGELYIWTDRNEKGKGFIGTHEKCVAVVRPVYTGDSDAAFWEEEQEANARLYIAAPDLLAACQALVDGFTQAGIGPCKEEDDDEDDGTAFTPDERFNVRMGREAIRKAEGGAA